MTPPCIVWKEQKRFFEAPENPRDIRIEQSCPPFPGREQVTSPGSGWSNSGGSQCGVAFLNHSHQVLTSEA